MYEIISGNIAEGILYQVQGDLTIEYNTIQYTTGETFLGVSGVTTYSVISSGGAETNAIIAISSDNKNAYPNGYTDIGQTWVNTVNSTYGTYAYELTQFNVFLLSALGTMRCEVYEGIGYGGTLLGSTDLVVADNNGSNKNFNFTLTTPPISLSPDATYTMKVYKVGGGTFGYGQSTGTYDYKVILNGTEHASSVWDFYVSGFLLDGVPGVVTEASTFLGQTTLIENDFFTGKFNDESKFLGQSTGIGIPFLYEVASGSIEKDVEYFVEGGTSITYNSLTVNAGTFFTGVDGVTTYTKTTGNELVTPASSFLGQSFSFENDFYLDLFTDESFFGGLSFSVKNDPGIVAQVSGLSRSSNFPYSGIIHRWSCDGHLKDVGSERNHATIVNTTILDILSADKNGNDNAIISSDIGVYFTVDDINFQKGWSVNWWQKNSVSGANVNILYWGLVARYLTFTRTTKQLEWRPNTGSTISVVCDDYLDDVWQNFHVNYGNGSMDVYLNGVYQGSADNSDHTTPLTVQRIFSSISASSIETSFDDLIIYNRLLNLDEINVIFNNK